MERKKKIAGKEAMALETGRLSINEQESKHKNLANHSKKENAK